MLPPYKQKMTEVHQEITEKIQRWDKERDDLTRQINFMAENWHPPLFDSAAQIWPTKKNKKQKLKT